MAHFEKLSFCSGGNLQQDSPHGDVCQVTFWFYPALPSSFGGYCKPNINNLHYFQTIFYQPTRKYLVVKHKRNISFRNSRSQKFFKICALQNFAKITEKYLCQSLFNNARNIMKKRPQHRCFPVIFAKFLRTDFFYRTPLVAASAVCKNQLFPIGLLFMNKFFRL